MFVFKIDKFLIKLLLFVGERYVVLGGLWGGENLRLYVVVNIWIGDDVEVVVMFGVGNNVVFGFVVFWLFYEKWWLLVWVVIIGWLGGILLVIW